VAAPNIETVASLAKRRGFVFPSSEVYGGLGSAWDYGPLGVELSNNVKRAWWRWLVYERDDIEGLDSSIILNRLVWKYSGHEETFHDPLVDCRECKQRFRADKLFEEYQQQLLSKAKNIDPRIEGLLLAEAHDILSLGRDMAFREGKIPCPNCGERKWTDIRNFNMMFQTRLGAISEEDDPNALAYLRPETAQGIFINFLNVQQSLRRKVPFGVAQIGKSFRNEVTPGNFILRTREFEQMEMEYFVRPDAEHSQLVDYWVEQYVGWYTSLGLSRDSLHLHEVPRNELAHYSRRTVDIMYRYFPERDEEARQFEELMGIAYRTDFDLKSHSKNPVKEGTEERVNQHSTEDLSYFDEAAKERFYPHVIEPAAGVNRSVLAFLMDAYTEKTTEKGEKRVILKLHPELAPIKVAVLPLAKNKPEIVGMAKAIKRSLQPSMRAVYDDTGGIGKLYARQDEIGTPFCVTVDHQSLEDEAVTVRDRDTWEQERVKVADLREHLQSKLLVQSPTSNAQSPAPPSD
jgi:glycyl-tRNA synthetase